MAAGYRYIGPAGLAEIGSESPERFCVRSARDVRNVKQAFRSSRRDPTTKPGVCALRIYAVQHEVVQKHYFTSREGLVHHDFGGIRPE